MGCGGRGSSVGEEQQAGMWGGGVPGLGQWVTATTFLFSKVDVNKFWKYIRGVPLSHPVNSATFFFPTFDLRLIRLKEKFVLI